MIVKNLEGFYFTERTKYDPLTMQHVVAVKWYDADDQMLCCKGEGDTPEKAMHEAFIAFAQQLGVIVI